jgi:putative transposase
MLERLNLRAADTQATGTSCYGFDCFLFKTDVLLALDFDPELTIGTPWWDYWFQLSYQLAGGKLFLPSSPVLIHLDHTQNWSHQKWFVQGKRMYAEFWSANNAQEIFPFLQCLDHANLTEYEITIFAQNTWNWLKAYATPVDIIDAYAWLIVIGREMVATLMRRMGIEAVYRRPNTSKPAPGHKIYPHLLRGMLIDRPNQVWAMDITYLPMARGFVYLAAVVDWFSRRVLAWKLSITLEVEFCIEAVEEALARYGRPEVFNTDQGSQFTSRPFTGLLLENKIAISMDGKAAWRDNVFVERLWRSVKYEEVYLHAYASVAEARAGLGRYLNFYNGRRPHSSLGARTPDTTYFNQAPLLAAA